MKQFTIHIPVADNEGNEFEPVIHASICAQACEVFGGYTFDTARSAGGWVDDNKKVYQEHMHKIHIASDSFKPVREFAQLLKETYKQKAMYVVETGIVNFI